ncbi:HSP20-like chaperone [Aaosphaeria arxii CBS 175.79]|uniref:HSP20-like chaperone n=1 Tax=Aaosphaeria arxii CBS 175.79 TaxID=1450172 RepID=A0A6A5X835_9PLEO|nr:HSP20-like chaperone [Aaosphaeria arxii CBS 175.79]KAF2008914.1 HSP20-like chaperone [Aaosphaeria arxii CBS 175.79]
MPSVTYMNQWGGWGGRGRSFNPFEFAAGLFDPDQADKNKDSEDFSPETDVFDTPSSFYIHISLPGAKKEDVGVNWDAEKSELSIAGVIYRPGDEDFLKTLAMDERKVGPFERKIRLGTRANPAQIDAEGITAKLEDGVLRVEVPKLEKEGFVEVRKVDIE